MIQTFLTIAFLLLPTQTTANSLPKEPLSIEQKITQELGEEFINIARCESGLRQFNDQGTVLISPTSDKGLFQINQVHWSEAKKRGIDLDTVDGNIAFAKILKEEGGTQPWFMSKNCWSKK